MAEYISRPNLMEVLTNGDAQRRIRAMSGTEAYDEFLTLLNAAPAADVAPVRHGMWLKAIDNDCEMHKCDQCGARVVKEVFEYENPNLYCYRCGAKMDGGDGV